MVDVHRSIRIKASPSEAIARVSDLGSWSSRPVEEVFGFLDDDVERFASWRRPPWMGLRRLSDGPVGVGTRYETTLSIATCNR